MVAHTCAVPYAHVRRPFRICAPSLSRGASQVLTESNDTIDRATHYLYALGHTSAAGTASAEELVFAIQARACPPHSRAPHSKDSSRRLQKQAPAASNWYAGRIRPKEPL